MFSCFKFLQKKTSYKQTGFTSTLTDSEFEHLGKIAEEIKLQQAKTNNIINVNTADLFTLTDNPNVVYYREGTQRNSDDESIADDYLELN